MLNFYNAIFIYINHIHNRWCNGIITVKIMIQSCVHCTFTLESFLVYLCAFVPSVKVDSVLLMSYQVWTICVTEVADTRAWNIN